MDPLDAPTPGRPSGPLLVGGPQVYLSCQSLGDVDAVCLAKELVANTTVKELLLGGNQISDAGAKAIGIALRSNTTLSTLSLVNNKITDVGAGELLSALQQNKTIKDIALTGNQVSGSVLSSLSLILLSRKTSSTTLDKRPSSTALAASVGSPLQKSSSGSSGSSQGTPGRTITPQRSALQLSISSAVPLRTCTGPRLLRYGSAGSIIVTARKAMRRKVSRPALVLKPNRLVRMAPAQVGKPDVDLSQIEAFVTHVTREKADALCHMFRSFCDPEQFLDLIKRRFDSHMVQRPALCRLLASWVESRLIPDFFEPFTNRKGQKGDRQRYNYIQLLFFISREELASQPGNDAATRIKLVILRAMEKRRRSSVGPQQQMAVAKTEQLPDKREQEYEERLFLVYVSLPPPLEVAQSISAYDACLMRQISDLVGLNWRNKQSPMPSQAIFEVIARSNNLSFWVASRILRHSKSLERRAATITLFIRLAAALKAIGNLNSVVGMLGGLNHGCVQRLRQTWEAVPAEEKQIFADLEALVDSLGNYRAYRAYLAELAKEKKPAIPYLALFVPLLYMGRQFNLNAGVCLRDLVFMEDGMPTAKDGKPNFEKVEVFRKVWEDMQGFATTTITAYPSATPFARFGAFAHVRARARHNAGTRADLKSDNVEAYFACLHGRSEDELDVLSFEAEPKVVTSPSHRPSVSTDASPVRQVQGRDLKDYNAASP